MSELHTSFVPEFSQVSAIVVRASICQINFFCQSAKIPVALYNTAQFPRLPHCPNRGLIKS
jgi:hypothetical protein